MKIIGICGSPRKDGNTEQLLGVCLEAARNAGCETELITLCDKSIKGCIACMQCKDKHLLLATRDLFLGQQSAFGNGYFQVRTLGTDGGVSHAHISLRRRC